MTMLSAHHEKMIEEMYVAIVGDEKFGHDGIIKKQTISSQKIADLELQIDLFKPVIASFVEKKQETKKLRNTIIGSCITLIIGMTGHIISLIIFNHK